MHDDPGIDARFKGIADLETAGLLNPSKKGRHRLWRCGAPSGIAKCAGTPDTLVIEGHVCTHEEVDSAGQQLRCAPVKLPPVLIDEALGFDLDYDLPAIDKGDLKVGCVPVKTTIEFVVQRHGLVADLLRHRHQQHQLHAPPLQIGFVVNRVGLKPGRVDSPDLPMGASVNDRARGFHL